MKSVDCCPLSVDIKIKIMKKILSFLICVFLSFNVFSQEEKFTPYQINFGFPLSTTNIKEAKEFTNAFSINMLVGISKNEKSLALAGISNIISNNATGLQVAGLSNHIGNKGYGAAVAGLINTTKDSYCGLYVSGICNYSAMGTGLQIAGISNITKDINIGVQISGVINYAKDIKGVQIAGVTNIANDVKGLQFAGVMNKAKKVKGVQFASLLNIAEESNFPIALVNIIKNGKMGIALSYDIMNNAMLSFRSGGKYTYGILGVGYNNLVNDGSKLVAEAGYGIHIPINDMLEINNEFKATSVGFSNNKTCFNASYLLAPSFTFAEHYNIFGGVSFNYLYSNYVNSNDLIPSRCLWSKDGNYNQRMFIGYQIGVQYVF